jgi:hypothetical protein
MLIASVAGGIGAGTLGVVAALAAPRLSGVPGAFVGWSGIVLFPILFIAIHWATIGRRRWTAIELVVWAGRGATARYAAVTGIHDPVDVVRASAWLAAHPHADGEPAETTYWRAFVHLLRGQDAEARVELARVPDHGDMELERATLAAQLDLAGGLPADVGAVDDLVQEMPPSDARAIAAVEAAALRSQVAWTCGDDDVAPVLAALPDVAGRADGLLVRRYWLPVAGMTLVVWAAIWLLLSLLG